MTTVAPYSSPDGYYERTTLLCQLQPAYKYSNGEFELLFTIPKSKETKFLHSASSIDWRPIKLGKATKINEIILPIYDQNIVLDSQKIRNLANITNLNISQYLQSLLELDKNFRGKR